MYVYICITLYHFFVILTRNMPQLKRKSNYFRGRHGHPTRLHFFVCKSGFFFPLSFEVTSEARTIFYFFFYKRVFQKTRSQISISDKIFILSYHERAAILHWVNCIHGMGAGVGWKRGT